MNIDAIPIIRLTIENMQQSILHHLGVSGSELGELIEQRVQEAVEDYPFDKVVREIVHAAINKSLEQYFSFGEGRTKIDTAVYAALNAALTK